MTIRFDGNQFDRNGEILFANYTILAPGQPEHGASFAARFGIDDIEDEARRVTAAFRRATHT